MKLTEFRAFFHVPTTFRILKRDCNNVNKVLWSFKFDILYINECRRVPLHG